MHIQEKEPEKKERYLPENPPKEIKDLSSGKYAVVFKNNVTEFWQISDQNELDDDGQKTGETKKVYSSLERAWAAQENGCDGANIRFTADASIAIKYQGPFKVITTKREHPIKKETRVIDIPIKDWSNIHVFLESEAMKAFELKTGEFDAGKFKVRVEIINTEMGPMKKMELIDKETNHVIDENEFEDWIKQDQQLKIIWDAVDRYADMRS